MPVKSQGGQARCELKKIEAVTCTTSISKFLSFRERPHSVPLTFAPDYR